MALLDSGSTMRGEGEVLAVRLRALRDVRVAVGLKEGNVRDAANRELLQGVAAEADGGSTALVTSDGGGAAYRLDGARPNPFDGRTSISFEVPAEAPVRVVIYDVAGRLVRTLAEGMYTAGPYVVEWDGADDMGRPVRSGVYFYAMQAGVWHSQRRMTLLK